MMVTLVESDVNTDPLMIKRLSRAVLSGNMPLAQEQLGLGVSPNTMIGGDPFDPIAKCLGRLEFTIMEQAIVRNRPEFVEVLGKWGGRVTDKCMRYVAEEYIKMCLDGEGKVAVELSKDAEVLQKAAQTWGGLINAMTHAGASWDVSVAAALTGHAYMHTPKEIFAQNAFLDQAGA